MFVTIDPGIHTGWALWSRVHGLVACGLGDPRQDPRHLVKSASETADLVHDAWIESQVIYPRSRARPADIIKLAHCAGEYAGMYRTVGVDVHYVEPAKWKGQLPKRVHHPRILKALTTRDLGIVEAACRGIQTDENILDAVGLGLWVLKRT